MSAVLGMLPWSAGLLALLILVQRARVALRTHKSRMLTERERTLAAVRRYLPDQEPSAWRVYREVNRTSPHMEFRTVVRHLTAMTRNGQLVRNWEYIDG